MTDLAIPLAQLDDWIEGLRAGDRRAADQLCRAVSPFLERRVRAMLRSFPKVSRWTQSDDVLQNVQMRLLRALTEVQPPSLSDFDHLATRLIRRELLDLVRHYARLNRQKIVPLEHFVPDGSARGPELLTPADDPVEREECERFHAHWEQLPVAQRETVGLIFYHGWTHAQVAELFPVSERTIQRHWEEARGKLRNRLQREQALTSW